MESFPYIDSALLTCYPIKVRESQKFKKAVIQVPKNKMGNGEKIRKISKR